MLVCLALAKGIFNTVKLGKEIDVSPKYLRKLAGPLEKAGLIKSIQGVHGGYLIDQDPADIKLKMIFEAFDEDTTLSRCFVIEKCSLFDECLVRPLWTYLESKLDREFVNISIEDILTKKFNKKK